MDSCAASQDDFNWPVIIIFNEHLSSADMLSCIALAEQEAGLIHDVPINLDIFLKLNSLKSSHLTLLKEDFDA